jgi:hypothetical protein
VGNPHSELQLGRSGRLETNSKTDLSEIGSYISGAEYSISVA